MTDLTALPALLALVASVGFGVQIALSRQAVAHLGSQPAAMVAIGVHVGAFLLGAPLYMQASDWFTPGFWVFALAGCFSPLLSMTFAYAAIRRIGPTVSATLSATGPLFAAGMAIALFGEALTWFRGIGTVITVAGVMLLSWDSRKVPHLVLSALAFATGAAVLRALNQNVVKWGLALLPDPFFAAFVSFAVSFVLAVSLYRAREGRLPVTLHRAGLLWATGAGLSGTAAIIALFGALLLGDVMTVSPIVGAHPVFAMAVATAARQERLGAQAVTGVLITVSGVVLVTLGAGG